MTKTIMVVEDEPGLQQLLKTELTLEDYDVLVAKDGQVGLDLYDENQGRIDLIILDWMLPKVDGLGVLRRIRRQDPQLPVIFLTARDFSGDKVAGLDAGADDYMTKPFEMEELLARIRVMFRRETVQQSEPAKYQIGNFVLDTKAHQVIYNDERIALTRREYGVLRLLFSKQGETLTRDEILDAVWGTEFVGQTNIVDVYVRQLRNKLKQLPDVGFEIQTVRGIGYTLIEA